MLFFKLYNWLKYKTFPSSFLFKNRLFIERDSKHRKIMNNFGLIFRNSRWNNYENINVNADFKNIYSKYLFKSFLILFIFFLLYFLNFTNNFFFNSISFFFWFAIDSFDYYFSFIIWSFFSFCSLSLSKLYFFINNYNQTDMGIASNSFLKKLPFNNISYQPDTFISKNDLNWFLYSWLNSENFDNKYRSACVELIFDSNVSKNIWNNNYDFFLNLYKSVFFLNLHNKDFYFYRHLFNNLLFNNNFKNISPFFDNTEFTKNYFNLIAAFYFKSKVQVGLNNHIADNYLRTGLKWNLGYLTLENFKDFSSVYNVKSGSFFLNDASFIELLSSDQLKNSNNFFFKNLLLINTLSSSVNFSKWNRWLYRYSLLHRKSIKFSQKLIFTKKLMNNGFYNSSVFKKNLWNSVYFNSKNLKSSHMTTFFDSYFNDFSALSSNFSFFNRSLQNSFMLDNRYTFLFFKFFETSYFWYLKRFFLFNSLNVNYSFSKLNLIDKNFNTNLVYRKRNDQFFNAFYFNFFIKNRAFFLQPLSFSTFSTDNLFFNNGWNSDLNVKNDIFSSSFDTDIFSKDNLSLLSIVSSNHSTPFFLYLNNSLFYDIFNKNFSFNNSNFNSNFRIKFINKFFFNTFTNQLINHKTDCFYFKDLLALSFYIK